MTELWIGPDGVAIDREPLPRGAEVWDMYGPLNTRYVYLVANGRPAAYPERSLPWVENPAAYHQFLVVGDCVHIRAAYERSEDAVLRRDLDDLVDIGYYRWDSPIFRGTRVASDLGRFAVQLRVLDEMGSTFPNPFGAVAVDTQTGEECRVGASIDP